MRAEDERLRRLQARLRKAKAAARRLEIEASKRRMEMMDLSESIHFMDAIAAQCVARGVHPARLTFGMLAECLALRLTFANGFDPLTMQRLAAALTSADDEVWKRLAVLSGERHA